MKRISVLSKTVLFAFILVIAVPFSRASAVNVNGNVEARNQSGVHEGDVYRNYLKADLELGESLDNTLVKVILRAEDDSLRPEKKDREIEKTDTTETVVSTRNHLADDYEGPQRVYLREAYISHDIYFDSIIDSVNLKLGRIIYTWGNADEQKPVDIINPQDYSNLYFTPMQERKIGVMSGTMSVFFTENFFIEGAVVPEFRSSEIASTVFTTGELEELRENTTVFDLDDPVFPDEKNSENSYAGRVGLMIFDIDMHGSWYYGYNHLPVNRFRFTGAPPVEVTPEYEKVQMFGFDFQRALFFGITLRGEGAYYSRGKYFYYDSDSSTGNILLSPLGEDLQAGGDGSVEKNYAEYTAGFDDHDFIFNDLYLNLQFSQKKIMDYEKTLAQDEYVSHILWTLKYFMFNKKFCISTKGAYNVRDESTYANGEFLFKFTDNFEFMLGGWVLEGEEDTDIGQFDENDMVYVAGKFTF
ncbi:MAG TPA: hypothetical protein PK358_12660 [Spirochaetota bacterium]|nr:hypothetical protein [Spirochaetota bacterium]HPJ35683.1 hypothetical protein [Spirochaetota bacterium]